jgi:hypothetical protein
VPLVLRYLANLKAIGMCKSPVCIQSDQLQWASRPPDYSVLMLTYIDNNNQITMPASRNFKDVRAARAQASSNATTPQLSFRSKVRKSKGEIRRHRRVDPCVACVRSVTRWGQGAMEEPCTRCSITPGMVFKSLWRVVCALLMCECRFLPTVHELRA